MCVLNLELYNLFYTPLLLIHFTKTGMAKVANSYGDFIITITARQQDIEYFPILQAMDVDETGPIFIQTTVTVQKGNGGRAETQDFKRKGKKSQAYNVRGHAYEKILH